MKKYFMIIMILALACKKHDLPVKKPVAYGREPKSIAIDSTLIASRKDSVLLDFYRTHGFGTVWNTQDKRNEIIDLIKECPGDGLLPEDYHLAEIQKAEKKFKKLSDAEFISYDLLLTRSLQKYLWQLSNGKLNPRIVYSNWDLKRNPIDVNTLISAAMKGDSLISTVNSCRPKHPIYEGLKQALLLVNKFPKDTIREIAFIEKIRKNDTSSTLPRIKRRLIYWKDMEPADTVTTIYDRKTFKAIKRFQIRHGLVADGVIGKGTVEALNFTKERRRCQIIANLERWRWFPREMGDHYIIVNIPGYYLRIIKDGDTIERKRVVVGKAERKTPVLSSMFNNIVFNPTWTVPPTIIREDLTPDATKNRGYFAAHNITIYDYKGRIVSPENWKPEKAKGYRYVQSPGDYNSLGNVKFNFPNQYSVYLHDTNHRDLFVKTYRSLSSGCVRVDEPLPLAQYMLNDSIRWPMDSIQKMVDSKKTTTIRLRQKIRLHQLYWTAWLERGNDLQFRDDIYQLDADLYKKLSK